MGERIWQRSAILADRREFLAAITSLAGAAALPGTIGRALAQGQERLVFGISSYPPGIRPYQHAGGASTAAKLMIHRGLLGYDYDGKIRGELAEKWELEGDRTLRLTLRSNAKFHNGDPVLAEDVVYSVQQIRSEDVTAYLAEAYRSIETVTATGEREVRITLKEPSAPFPHHLASAHSPIISRKSTANAAIGAGPYRIAEQERGSRISFTAFEDFYRKGHPKFAKVDFIAYPDERLRVAALVGGDVDLIDFVPWQEMEAIRARKDIYLDDPDEAFMGLIFNMTSGPFADPRVRQAAAFAVNRDDIIKAAFFGRGVPINGLPFPRTSPLYQEKDQQHWSYNPERAKSLLAEAGLASGFKTSLLSTAQYGMHKDTAEVVQQNLAAVGIQAELQLPEWATRVQIGNRGQYAMAITGYSLDYNDPDSLSNLLNSNKQGSFLRSYGYENPKIDKIFAAGRAELDETKRKQIYSEMSKVAIADASLVGLVWRSQAYAMKANIKDFRTIPGSLNYSIQLLEQARRA